MSKHTEGPWHVEARKGDTCICRADGAILARLGASTNWRANASLIAAAPDLLEALKELLQGVPEVWNMEGAGMYPEVMRARAAIAKAEGKA